MFPRRCRSCRGPYSPCICLGAVAVGLWLLLLLSNSVTRSRTERSFEARHAPVLESRRQRHSRALRLEIKALMGRAPPNWTDFLNGPLADNFRGAPCGCGHCPGSATLPSCQSKGVRLLGDLSVQVRLDCLRKVT